MREVKPIWTSASFLVYTGGFIVLASAIAALAYLSSHYASGAEAGWALLVLVVLYGIAHALRLQGRAIAAGIFAFASVIAWGAFVALLFIWFGWDGVRGSIEHWSWSRLALWLLILAAAWDDHRRFRFPLIRLVSVVVTWLFVIDLITAGGSWTAVVSLLLGLVYFVVGTTQGEPSAFWLHLVGGLLVGGSLLYWLHSGDVEWAFLGTFAALFIAVGARVRRSSWAVLGTLGLVALATHYSIVWTRPPTASSGLSLLPLEATPAHNPWAPIVTFAVLGFGLVAFGLVARRFGGSATPPASPGG